VPVGSVTTAEETEVREELRGDEEAEIAERSTIQSLVVTERVPERMMVPQLSRIVTAVEVYNAVKPQSHSKPIERREPIQFGKTSTCRAAIGKEGISSKAVWVDETRLPSGSVTTTGCLARCTFNSTEAS
jgi:hypothetical protein